MIESHPRDATIRSVSNQLVKEPPSSVQKQKNLFLEQQHVLDLRVEWEYARDSPRNSTTGTAMHNRRKKNENKHTPKADYGVRWRVWKSIHSGAEVVW